MIVIIDISVPSDAFPLGGVFEEHPDVEIELERVVPLRDSIIPLFWIDGGNARDIEGTLSSDSLTKTVRRLTETEGRSLYEVRWTPNVNGLVEALIETNAKILGAEGTADVWDFRLQFSSRDELVTFREQCEANDIPLTLRRLYNPTVPEDDGRLTTSQHEALIKAYQQGYFEVPRNTSMKSLADDFGISDSALSQRIRRGTSALIAETLAADL